MATRKEPAPESAVAADAADAAVDVVAMPSLRADGTSAQKNPTVVIGEGEDKRPEIITEQRSTQ